MKISIAYLEYNSQYLLTPDSHIRSSFLQRKMGRVRESEDRLHMEGCDGDTVSKVQKKSLLPQEANTFLILQGVIFDYYPKKSRNGDTLGPVELNV